MQHDDEMLVVSRGDSCVEGALARVRGAERVRVVSGIEQPVPTRERVSLHAPAIAPSHVAPELRTPEGRNRHDGIMAPLGTRGMSETVTDTEADAETETETATETESETATETETERARDLIRSAPMADERRRAPRFALWFPMQIVRDGEVILAISRDVSEVGVLLVAAAAPKVGAQVTLTMQLPGDAARTIEGTIVRVDPNTADLEGLWRHRVAVELAERVDGLEPLLEEISRTSHPPPDPNA